MNACRVLSIFLLTAAIARAAGPYAASLPAILLRLSDADPDVRTAARVELMELTPEDLPALKSAVAAAGPLTPEQSEALRTAVVHVLTRQTIAKLPKAGSAFMGVLLAKSQTLVGPDADSEPPAVRGTLPGFAAARVLEGGDFIVGLEYAGETVAFATSGEVIQYVGQLPPGTAIELIVRRGMRTLKVPLRLDARPVSMGPALQEGDRIATLVDNAVAEAERGYETMFAANPVTQ